MYEILKAIAISNAWFFNYGRSDFNNLTDIEEQKNTPHIFLDPVTIKDIDNESGVKEKETYTGSFMILYSSDIDETDYETRFIAYIKPILQSIVNTIKDSIRCGYDVSFDLWQVTEVINIFDYNFDGVIVSYQITIDL